MVFIRKTVAKHGQADRIIDEDDHHDGDQDSHYTQDDPDIPEIFHH
jgi:hypothetical protein